MNNWITQLSIGLDKLIDSNLAFLSQVGSFYTSKFVLGLIGNLSIMSTLFYDIRWTLFWSQIHLIH